MVSTPTPAAAANFPMVIRGFMLDSVPMYGEYSEFSEKKNKTHGIGNHEIGEIEKRDIGAGMSGGNSRLDLLPGAAGADHTRLQRRVDRKFDRARTLSTAIHHRGGGCVVFCLAAHLSPGGEMS